MSTNVFGALLWGAAAICGIAAGLLIDERDWRRLKASVSQENIDAAIRAGAQNL